jgi:hypothetical protein
MNFRRDSSENEEKTMAVRRAIYSLSFTSISWYNFWPAKKKS